ncbi:SAF domain-containing protein [Lancefieldella sp. Marseille-Q7238]|uniref:SAF domain-containing protein n=1 Tax=Lancefieldella sp. Marseille-Q7238 TaxID=3022127 RepID=UPI0024A8DCFD|nr:SAF domain-containing protein [Lancefieldella sp. Marseille-Q7238]
MSRRFRFILSGACALLAVLCCIVYGNQIRAEAEQSRAEVIERYGGEVVNLVVATRPIEAGDTVSSSNTQVKSWVSDLAPEGSFTNADDIMGKQVTIPVSAGTPLTQLNFRSEKTAVSIPKSLVGLSISHGEKTGLVGRVSAGTTLAAYEMTEHGIRLLSTDVTLLSDTGEGASLSGTPLVLGVLPKDMTSILSAEAKGTLRLVVPGDEVDMSEITTQNAPTEVRPDKADVSTSSENAAASDNTVASDGTAADGEQADVAEGSDDAEYYFEEE